MILHIKEGRKYREASEGEILTAAVQILSESSRTQEFAEQLNVRLINLWWHRPSHIHPDSARSVEG